MRKALLFLAVPVLWAGVACWSEPTEGGLIFHRGARRGCSGFAAGDCSGFRYVRVRYTSACCCEEPVQTNYGCAGSAGQLELRQPTPPRNPNLLNAPTIAPGNSGPVPDTANGVIDGAGITRPSPATLTPPAPRE